MAKSNNAAMDMGHPVWRWICILIVIIVVIVGVCMLWKSHQVVACTPQNLQLTAGQQSGAAGTIYQHMALKNTGKKTCSISGYPTAFLYGSDGYALGSAAAARPNPAAGVVTLAADETAHTVLGYPQAGNFNPGVCSAPSTTLRLYPPSATMPLELALTVPWCPGFSATPFEAGS